MPRPKSALQPGGLERGGAYLLTWNPARWNQWDPKQEADAVRRGRPNLLEWSTGPTGACRSEPRSSSCARGGTHRG